MVNGSLLTLAEQVGANALPLFLSLLSIVLIFVAAGAVLPRKIYIASAYEIAERRLFNL